MQRNFFGTWGFVIAGIIFLIAAIIPLLAGQTFNAAFFVIGIACLVIGTAVARKKRADTPPKSQRTQASRLTFDCSRRILREFWEKDPDASVPLQTWFHDVERTIQNTPADYKTAYQNASFVANHRVVFNIKGNHHRLVVVVVYQHGVVYIRFVGTYEEYDRIDVTTI